MKSVLAAQGNSNKAPQLEWLRTTEIAWSHSYGGQKSEIKESAGPYSLGKL